jgi:hypothetical protein
MKKVYLFPLKKYLPLCHQVLLKQTYPCEPISAKKVIVRRWQHANQHSFPGLPSHCRGGALAAQNSITQCRRED